MRSVVVPVHDTQSTFISALSRTTTSALFTMGEKKVLAALCFLAFSLPLSVSLIVLKIDKPVALRVEPEQVANLTPEQSLHGNDDLAMAEIFLDKANETLSDPVKSAMYLSQAQSLLDLTEQSGPRVENLKQKLAPAPQRIAAPGSTLGTASISASTKSNANEFTVVMPAESQSLFVPYANLQSDSQIYVTIPYNRDNTVIYVSSRETGRGFTLATVAPLLQDITVQWYEISSQ